MSVLKWQSLQQSADRARKAVDHAKAVDHYTKALAQSNVPWQAYVDLALACAYCQRMLGRFSEADTLLTRLAEMAITQGDDAAIVMANAELLYILRFTGDNQRALQLGKQALDTAERSNQPGIKAEALLSLGIAYSDTGEYQAAETCLSETQALIQPGDQLRQLKALFLGAFLLWNSDRYQEAVPSAMQAVEIARSLGDHDWEGIILNLLGILTIDLARERSFYQQALKAFEAAGDQPYQLRVLLNSCEILHWAGLYQRAIELDKRALKISDEIGQSIEYLHALFYLVDDAIWINDLQAAGDYLNAGLSFAQEKSLPEVNILIYKGLYHILLKQPDLAIEAIHKAEISVSEQDQINQAVVFTFKIYANLLAGNHHRAREIADQVLSLISSLGDRFTFFVGISCWACYRALLRANAMMEKTKTISQKAWRVLDLGMKGSLIRVEDLSDAGLRRGYLHRNDFIRQLILEWLIQAPLHGVNGEQMASFIAQVQKPGRLDDVFKRLLDIGVRLNTQRDPNQLPDEILQEVDELMGAERIALVLLDDQGKQKLAKTLLPRPAKPALIGKAEETPDPKVFLGEIAPWIQEVITTRQGLIHQLNPEAVLADQLSMLITPLISQGKLLGVIYCDLRGCFGRFAPEDLNLLGVMANQSAVALENADWSATLEQRVSDRTAELKKSNERLEQRTAELTIINRVQDGLVKQLDFQSIIDLVGDEIMRVFPPPKRKIRLYSVFIALYDPHTNLIRLPFWKMGNGKRLHPIPFELGEGLTSQVILSRQPLVFKTWEEDGQTARMVIDDGNPSEFAQSWLGVPILTGDKASGVICVQDPRKDLFTPADVRLLSTLAASLGVALENARLFDETQRLLKETEQRNAELAVINSVQSALAAELDIQGIYDAVGDKIREIFKTGNVDIRVYDPKTNILYFTYNYEQGVRFTIEPMLLPEKGFAAYVIHNRETLIINEKMEQAMEKYGSYTIPGTEADVSNVWVPIVVGDQARGLVCLADYEHEHAFSESDVRLLQTLVNSMSVALENARLFNETQRLLMETEQRNAELAILNSVSQALVKQLNVDAIIKIVGDQVRDTFKSECTTIYLYEPKTNVITANYAYDRGYVTAPPLHYGEGLTSIVIRTREPLVLLSAKDDENLGTIFIGDADGGEGVTQSYLGVPIIVGDDVIGVVSVQSYQENAYGKGQVSLLSTLAASMGIAIANARQFQAEQERVAELQIINSIQHGLAAELDFQAIVDLVGDKLREVFNLSDLMISWYDESSDLAHHLYIYDHGKRITAKPTKLSIPGCLYQKFTKNRQPMIWNNREESADYLTLPGTNASLSGIAVPIISSDHIIGGMQLFNVEKENAIGESELRLLTTISGSMGSALENARLFEETRRLLAETEERNRELAIISRIGQALAGQLDPQGIFELVGKELEEIFDAQVVAIITYDKLENLCHWRYFIEKGVHHTVPPSTPAGFSGHILQTRQSLLIGDHLIERAAEMGSTVIAGELPKSYLGVPLIAGGEVTGVISLQNIDQVEAFSENDLRLLSTLALNMGVALENARLYQETQHHADEMAALAEIGSDIASTHEMTPVLERLATKTRELMQVRDIALYLLQPDGYMLKPIVSQGKYAKETMARMVSLDEGMTGNIARRGVAEIINEPEHDPRAVHIEGTPSEEEELECMMIAPLISRGKVIGVLSVYRDRDQGSFTQPELDFLVGLARQAAIAIESARLYSETERRATEMAALAEVSREISSTLELQVVLKRIANQARELLVAGNSAVYLLQSDGKTIKAIAAEGSVANEVLADEVLLGEGIIGSIVKSGVAEWIDDTDKDPRAVQIPGTQASVEGEKLLVAPLMIQNQTIGALAVWRDPDDPLFNQAELSFAISLAQQAVVAIDNARLFESAQESQRRMADMINFLPDATFVIDRQGNVIAWNHAIEEMTGVKAIDILGKGEYEYALPFYGERRPILIDMVLLPDVEIEKKYTHIHKYESVWIGEAISSLKDKLTYLNATASALKNSKGEAVGAIESIRDITDQKHAEQELQQAKLEAEQANQAKSAFLAMMSHEIRTPMNAIIGMSGLLMDTPLNPDQLEFAETIRSSGDSLLNIINDILDFSKIEAGKMTLEEQPFDLRECIEASLDLIKVSAYEKNLELAYEMDQEVPVAILGDVTRLRQVLINLLGNSVKFTDHGEIVLAVSKGEKMDSLHFSVRDTGIGIPQDRISQLFRPFTQADASTSRRYGGTGLGLALSSRIIELMGGEMWVESEGIPGKGSIFHFNIFAKAALEWKGRQLMQGEHPQLRDRHLLVVDDNATNRRILQLQTQTWGMLTRECATPDEALEILRKGERFDLAILDMHMPDLSGIELAAKIRELESSTPGASRMPLVLSTSLGGREEARESTEFAAILLKPIRQSALFDMLMSLFTDKSGSTIKPTKERFAIDREMASHHPLRILLAEDNVVNQKLAIRLLSQMGYRADVAANGLEVLQAVKRQPYDVILMDVQMPEMDGLEATRQLCAEISAKKRPRIIAMTANAMQGDREMCIEAGMDDYLSKPIRVDELVAALNMVQSLNST